MQFILFCGNAESWVDFMHSTFNTTV